MSKRELFERTKVSTETGCYYDDIPVSEQEIVKPYFDRLKEEIDKIYDRDGSSFDCLNALDELKEFIDKYKVEGSDKE